jgi:hypothetical protein
MPTIGEKTSVVFPKVMKEPQLMAAAEFAFKSPFILLFQRGNFLRRTLTPPFDGLGASFWKRGKEETFRRNELQIMWQISGTGNWTGIAL